MYQERIRQLDAEVEAASNSRNQLWIVMLVNVGVLGYMFFSGNGRIGWSIPVIIIAIAFQRSARYGDQANRIGRLRVFYQRGLDRIAGDWIGKGHTGEEYRESAHLYDQDLNILGTGSLFELLSTARTEIGRGRLAGYLLNAASPEEALARQAAVQELRDQTKLREAVVLLGKYNFSDCDEEAFGEFLDMPAASFPPGLSYILLVTPIALMVLAFAGLTNFRPWPEVVPFIGYLALFQGAVAMMLQARVKPILDHARTLAAEVGILGEGLTLLSRQKFKSPKLAELTQRATAAPSALRQIERYMYWVRERDKDWLYALAIYTMMGTQLGMAIARWHRQHAQHLRAWIDTWGEFEALVSLATYAHEHRADVYPTFLETAATFEADGLGHPLLAEDRCVRNDVSFVPECRFWIISGSNMAGKSTLLRSIGINTVLALAGAPVRATRLELSPLRVCASISPADSLLEGKSRFMAEVERIRDTLLVASGAPVLFLIDEIFSGTNSHDRRIAAESVVRALIRNGAVGAMSTHDLALTEIAALDGLTGKNVHMCSRDDGDALDFDYLIKPGVNRQSNALAIARLAGVDV